MLYYLSDLLTEWQIPGSRLFYYVSFRTTMAFILALVLATWVGSGIINYLRKHQIGEVVRDLGLEGEASKKNTPTMGGIIIILAILIPTLLWARLDNIYVILMIITTLLMAMVGFLDDYIKVFRKNKDGLKGKYKILVQVILGLIIGTVLYLSPEATIRENKEVRNEGTIENVLFEKEQVKSTKTTIPFFKNNNFDYADILPVPDQYKQVVGWLLFITITILIITYLSNCVNLTDGLDGLAAGSSAPVGLVLLILAYVSSHIQMASYLNIMYIPGAEELVIFAAAFVGATIGFLWFNSYPAQVFMGDTGSLALGGIIAAFAIIIRKEFLLPIMCGLFIIEGLSTMLQVGYYKYTRKRYGEPRRILRMAPLHHHFQKGDADQIKSIIQHPHKKIAENKIVVRFWLIAIILAALSVATLKMR